MKFTSENEYLAVLRLRRKLNNIEAREDFATCLGKVTYCACPGRLRTDVCMNLFTGYREPVELVHPRSKMTKVGFWARSIAPALLVIRKEC